MRIINVSGILYAVPLVLIIILHTHARARAVYQTPAIPFVRRYNVCFKKISSCGKFNYCEINVNFKHNLLSFRNVANASNALKL